MGKASRDKGATGERELAKLLSEMLGSTCVRNLEQTRDGGHDIRNVGPFALEVKRYKTVKPAMIFEFWRQAEAQAMKAGKTPALAVRQDLQEWVFYVEAWQLMPEISHEAGLAAINIRAFADLVKLKERS